MENDLCEQIRELKRVVSEYEQRISENEAMVKELKRVVSSNEQRISMNEIKMSELQVQVKELLEWKRRQIEKELRIQYDKEYEAFECDRYNHAVCCRNSNCAECESQFISYETRVQGRDNV